MSTVVSKEKLVITEHGQYKVCIRAKRLLAEQNNLWDTCNPDLPVEKLRAIVKPEFPGPHALKRSIVYVEVPVAEGLVPCSPWCTRPGRQRQKPIRFSSGTSIIQSIQAFIHYSTTVQLSTSFYKPARRNTSHQR